MENKSMSKPYYYPFPAASKATLIVLVVMLEDRDPQTIHLMATSTLSGILFFFARSTYHITSICTDKIRFVIR